MPRRNTTIPAERTETRRNQLRTARQQQQRPRVTRGSNLLRPFDAGAFTSVCGFCKAYYWAKEKLGMGIYNKCCRSGVIGLPIDIPYPDFLKDILVNRDNLFFNNFRTHIHSYNAAFRFAGVSDKQDQSTMGGRSWLYRVSGNIYHIMRPIVDTTGSPNLGQLYLLNADEATNVRSSRGRRGIWKRDLLLQLHSFFASNNPYAMLYKMMGERTDISGTVLMDYALKFLETRLLPQGEVYNPPAPEDVASVISLTESNRVPQHLLVVRYALRGAEQSIFLPLTTQHRDPCCYPLLFPFVHMGWNENLSYIRPRGNLTNISLREYIRFYLHVRENTFSPMFHANNIFQQYVVDAFINIENRAISFLQGARPHMIGVNGPTYVRNIANEGNNAAPFMFPTDFIGSDGYMRERFHDAMALVGRFGPPDLFITYSCNPKAPEIVNALNNDQPYQGRPDLVVRSFQLRVRDLIDRIVKKSLLGKIMYYFFAVEFQKRGLPHIHMCVKFNSESAITSVGKVDELISAELPDPSIDFDLFKIVVDNMIHGPCNENCLIDNQCKKKYPKRFIEQTVFVSNDFPHYRRRNLPSIIYMGEDYNNSFVVPYNRELCKIYSSHINVELCSSLGTIKYLNKYITKGMEAQNQPVGQGTNEADRYRNSRFDTAMEAAWRIFEFPMWQISHSVMGLPVHLDDRNPTETLVTGFGRNVTRNTPRSKLEAFFLLTETDESARVYSYVQIPEFYKWAEVVARLWIRRTPTHSGQLGRLYPVPIFEQERYALRLLLCHVIGPRSFTDIRTVNGTLHPSYVEAAKALGLIETTHPYELTFREAVDFATPKQLRVLFVNLLGYGMPNGVSLFNEFFNVLSGDFGSQTLFVNRRLYLIYLIKRLFEQRDKVALDFLSFNDFQSIDIEMPNTIENNVEDLPTLNPQQRSVFNNIVEKVTSAVSCLVYLDGPAGTGKTFLINRVITHLKAINKFSIVCAPTGLAASLLIGGRTLHSFFNIPLCIEETSRCGIKRNSQRAQFIREASLLIIDEVGMVDANVLNMINHLMKKIMNNDRDFGGKIVLFTGDLRQLSFVYPDSHPFVFETCVFALSEFYQACEKLALVENMRSYSSPAYVHFIQNIGDGVGMTETVQYGRVSEIPVCYLSTNLVVDIYSGLNELSENELLMRQLLCSTNRKVDEYNMKILNLLEGDEYSLTGINKLGGNPRGYITNNYTPEILARLDIDSLPPTNIEVKLNCPLVILRNFDIWCGVVNGTKAILKRVFNNSLELLIMSGKSKGEYFILPRVYFNTEVDQLPFELIRQQYPIRVAFASTIHKSQGQTYDFVGVSLENPVFCHGQLYVALSRCTSGRNMKVTVSGSRYQGVEEGITYVVNVVNRNILGE